MTTAAITTSSSTASGRSLRGLVAGAILVLAAIVVVLALTVGHVGGSTTGTSGRSSGPDTSLCRPSHVVHYC